MMKRFGQTARLKPDKIEEYRQLHASVWPEVLDTITACHIGNYSIFQQDDLLFAYFEYHGNDYDADMRAMAEDPVTQRWWKLTKPCFLHHSIQEYYTEMPEIFYHQ
jgi:L-rhamnose mutarotase